MFYYRKIGEKNFPFTDLHAHDPHNAKVHREYELQRRMDDFYYKAFSLIRYNRVPGDYLEFGCGSTIRSFRFALKYSRLEPFENRRLFAFDSFAGLPEVSSSDHEQWKTGSMAVSVDQFREVLGHYDAKEGRDFHTVQGFFDKTLVGHKPEEYGLNAAAFVHVDCDLYSSTVPVLEFITPLLQPGTVLSFDDWYCENADPRRGEQRAFNEWRKKSGKKFRLDPYHQFGWHGMSFIVNPASPPSFLKSFG
ncbi:TylF/MycF/NovP-related O-methyltransferase [Ciceribacter sp. L1K22]|uniref:TylF/MycF/NovP-related O-methyltransferase n=1 Tax=Ciceribacter sp. L1K22 TaxID=2820275 RepID=UPI001ABEC147|nr:TylF/MycF/NovP-related O-methyltransferase [Ciceribacter sp. L1K22]MBO3760042.1 hypothetical protein [Ciceribacter sp. L1K22]